MKGKYLPFLILPISLFSFFLANPLSVQGVVLPEEEGEWVDSSVCTAVCGTTDGKKTQTLYIEACEKTCPTVDFSASRDVLVSEGYYLDCPAGYVENAGDATLCEKFETSYAIHEWVATGRHSGYFTCELDDSKFNTEKYYWNSWFGWTKKECSRSFVTDTVAKEYVEPVYETQTYGPISVKYLFDKDSEVCTRPSADMMIHGCRNAWAKSFYNEQMPVTKDLVDTDTCELVPTETTRVVDCEAELVACPVEDEPEILGTTDTTTTSTVVLAETGASSNIFVYIVQGILMLATLVSGTVFVKKYII